MQVPVNPSARLDGERVVEGQLSSPLAQDSGQQLSEGGRVVISVCSSPSASVCRSGPSLRGSSPRLPKPSLEVSSDRHLRSCPSDCLLPQCQESPVLASVLWCISSRPGAIRCCLPPDSQRLLSAPPWPARGLSGRMRLRSDAG